MNAVSNVQQIAAQIHALSPPDRQQVLAEALRQFAPVERQAVERLLRRLQHPGIPEDVWEGFEDAEDGRFVDLESALNEPYPVEGRGDGNKAA